MKSFEPKLADVDWHTELQNKVTLDTWKLIQDKIFSVVDSSIPEKRRRINNKLLWMNRNIMRTIRKKRRLWKWFCNTHDGKDYNAGLEIRGGHGSWPPQWPPPKSPTVAKNGHRDWAKSG